MKATALNEDTHKKLSRLAKKARDDSEKYVNITITSIVRDLVDAEYKKVFGNE